MVKKTHLIKAGSLQDTRYGRGLCGRPIRSKGKGTTDNKRVTCTDCRKLAGIVGETYCRRVMK